MVAGSRAENDMKPIRCFPLVAFLLAGGSALRGDGQGDPPWHSLFSGTDLSGWVRMSNGHFVATNGVIQVAGGKGWLRTERQFSDFILEIEGRGLETNFNGGIFIRAPLDGTPWPTNVWQVNLKQTAIGELLEGSARVVPSKLPPRPVGDWIKFRLEVRGHSISLEVDGQQIWKFEKFIPSRGFIGLQAEGKTVEFRNLRIGELPTVDAPILRSLSPPMIR
jgi:hypothetical protein